MRSIFFFLAFALAFSSAFDCGVYTVRDTETYERAKQCSSFSTLSVSWRSNVTLDLEFENVTYISNTLDLTTNINVTSVSFPNLETIGVTFSVSNNVGLKDISLPQARSNSATFTVNNNVDLESFTMAGGIATSVQLTNNNGTNQRFHFTDLNYVKGSLALVANEAVSFQIDNLVSVTADFTIGNNPNLVDLVVSSNSTEQGTSVLGSFSLATSPLTGNVVLPFTLLTIVNVAEIESVVLSLPQLVTLRGTLTVLQCDNLVQVSLPLFTSSLNAGFSVRDLPKLNLFNAPGPFQVANGIEFLRVGTMSSPSTITLGLQSTLTGSLTVSNCYLSSVQLSELSYVAKDIIFSNNVVTGTISISGSPVAVYGRVNFIYNAVGVAIYAPALQVLSEELVVASNYPLNPTTGYAVNFGGLSKVFTFLTVQNNTGINAIDLSSLVLVGGYFDNPTPYAPQTDFNIEFNTFVSGATIDCPQNSTVFGKFTFQNNTNDGSLTASFGFVKIGGDLVVSNSQFDSLHFDSLQCASKITFSGNSGGLATFNSLSQLSNSIIANTDNNNNFTVRGVAPPSGQSQTSPCVACTSDVEEGCSADFKVSQWTSSCGICTASLHSVSSPNPPTQANAPFQFPTLTGPDTPTDSSETSQAPENSAVEQSTAVVQTQKTNAAIGSSSTLIVSSVVLIASFLFVF